MGRLYLAVGLAIVLMVALISFASSGVANRITDLSGKGKLFLVGLLCLALWAGWFYYEGGVDHLLWLHNVPARPVGEREFVSLTERALQAWSAEQDPRERDRKCLVQTREIAEAAAQVTHWTGTVSTVYQLGSKAVLVVKIGRYTYVRTSYNIAADAILIDRGTSAFDHTAGLETGDPVRFSGAQAIDAERCIFDLDGPALDPGANVMFRFTSVDRIGSP
jgi:hypothetical protein